MGEQLAALGWGRSRQGCWVSWRRLGYWFHGVGGGRADLIWDYLGLEGRNMWQVDIGVTRIGRRQSNHLMSLGLWSESVIGGAIQKKLCWEIYRIWAGPGLVDWISLLCGLEIGYGLVFGPCPGFYFIFCCYLFRLFSYVALFTSNKSLHQLCRGRRVVCLCVHSSLVCSRLAASFLLRQMIVTV